MSESTTPPLTLGDLLEKALAERLEGDEPRGEDDDAEGWSALIRSTLSQALPRAVEAGDGHRVLSMVREAMDVPVSGILAAAWQRYDPFRAYVDPVTYPPGTETEVPLADHTARSTMEPEVDVMAAGTVLATLRFTCEMTLTLKGAVVIIRDGRFRSARTGDCSVTARLSFEGHTLAEMGPEKERIPGTVRFGPQGIPIEPFAEDPYATDSEPPPVTHPAS